MIVAALPMFDAVASASRNGSGRSRALGDDVEHQRREHQADRVVDEQRRQHAGREHQHDSSARGMATRAPASPRDRGQAASQPQVGDDDHHAEQQHDGAEVDGRARRRRSRSRR